MVADGVACLQLNTHKAQLALASPPDVYRELVTVAAKLKKEDMERQLPRKQQQQQWWGTEWPGSIPTLSVCGCAVDCACQLTLLESSSTLLRSTINQALSALSILLKHLKVPILFHPCLEEKLRRTQLYTHHF